MTSVGFNTADLWNLAVFLWSVLCALPTDGEVVVSKAGETVKLACGLPTGRTLEWHHEGDKVVRVSSAGMTSKGYWSGSIHRLYCFQSCSGADSAHVLCQGRGNLLRGEPFSDKSIWRSRA